MINEIINKYTFRLPRVSSPGKSPSDECNSVSQAHTCAVVQSVAQNTSSPQLTAFLTPPESSSLMAPTTGEATIISPRLRFSEVIPTTMLEPLITITPTWSSRRLFLSVRLFSQSSLFPLIQLRKTTIFSTERPLLLLDGATLPMIPSKLYLCKCLLTFLKWRTNQYPQPNAVRQASTQQLGYLRRILGRPNHQPYPRQIHSTNAVLRRPRLYQLHGWFWWTIGRQGSG